MVVSSPKKAEVGQPGPYHTQPRAGADVETTCSPIFLCLFLQSLRAVWQLWLQTLSLSAVTTSSFGRFPKMALEAIGSVQASSVPRV